MAGLMAIGNAVTRPQVHNFSKLFINPTRKNAIFKASSFCSSSSGETRKLILYSKPGCCLCDGLKEKLDAAFSIAGPNSISDVHLQIRDITSNPEWEKLYQYEIPVLARVREDGTEETLSRLSPRLGVELVQKKITAAFTQDNARDGHACIIVEIQDTTSCRHRYKFVNQDTVRFWRND